ncbi:MAG: hypothetical protein Q4C91_21035 [Eubacteriales bacterium]|nr:hypothetical protein [Eubacteriales bacterium]
MVDVIKTDFGRALKSWRFPLAVVLMFLVWELNSKRFVHSQDVLYLFVHVWGRSITPLLAMVVTSLVYVSSYCEDVENHFLRYCIKRTGIRKYIMSKLLVVFCTSFMVVVLGSILFIVRQRIDLPLAAADSITVQNFKPESCFGWLLPEHTAAYMAVQLFMDGLYCASMSMLALALSTFVRNSHAVFALPFLLNYFFMFLFSRLAPEFPMLYVEQIYNSAISTYTDSPVILIAYAIFVTLLFAAVSWTIMLKKTEGEFR